MIIEQGSDRRRKSQERRHGEKYYDGYVLAPESFVRVSWRKIYIE
jgi:hypothetical protein